MRGHPEAGERDQLFQVSREGVDAPRLGRGNGPTLSSERVMRGHPEAGERDQLFQVSGEGVDAPRLGRGNGATLPSEPVS
jgi:hypothetical protein